MTVQTLQFFLNNANFFQFLNFKFPVTLIDFTATWRCDTAEVPTLVVSLFAQSGSPPSSLVDPPVNQLIDNQLTYYLSGINPGVIYQPVDLSTTRMFVGVATYVNPFEVLLAMRVGYGGKGVDLDQKFVL